MRCETSFFSPTLYKKHLQRYWPLWGVWFAIWLLVIPVPLWNAYRNGVSQARLTQLVEEYPDMLGAMSLCIALAAILVAVAVWFHLFKSPAAQFLLSLPLRREGVFATGYLAGYTMLAVPLLAVSLVTVLVEWAVGFVEPRYIFTWLGGCLLLAFFWFSFATLCCVITGNAVAGPSFYLIFNGVIAVMTWLVQTVLEGFLYGFDALSDAVWEAVIWLTPIARTTNNLFRVSDSQTGEFEMLWIYAGVGFLMLLAALGLHHIRKAERAGDLVAFGPLRMVFKVCVSLCGGLSLGLVLVAILFEGRDVSPAPALAGCCAVAAVVSWYASEMLLAKSFKVFRGHWKGALLSAAAFVLAICALEMDWIGFTTRVPRADQVRQATVEIYGSIDSVASSGDGLLYDDPQAIQALVELHQYLCDHKEEVENIDESDDYYYSVQLSYDLGLARLTRSYGYWTDSGSPLDQVTLAAAKAGRPDFDVTRETPDQGTYIHYRQGTDEDGWNGDIQTQEALELTTAQLEELWAAIREDVTAGRYRVCEEWEDNYFELCWIMPDDRVTYEVFYVRPGCTSVLAALERLGMTP